MPYDYMASLENLLSYESDQSGIDSGWFSQFYHERRGLLNIQRQL